MVCALTASKETNKYDWKQLNHIYIHLYYVQIELCGIDICSRLILCKFDLF